VLEYDQVDKQGGDGWVKILYLSPLGFVRSLGIFDGSTVRDAGFNIHTSLSIARSNQISNKTVTGRTPFPSVMECQEPRVPFKLFDRLPLSVSR